MRAYAFVLLAASLPALFADAQSAAPASDSSQVLQPVPTIRTGTQLVIVDVVVQDKQGNPVRGLSKQDFVLTEKKQPQTLRNFEEHSTLNPPKPGEPMPPLPPGSFTNYTATPASGALNVLLLDALNTPMADQAYVRYELQQYVKKAQPGTRIAIFGLSQRLFMLQGFTSEPTTLRDAVQHKLIPRASTLLDDPVGTGADQMTLSGAASDMGLDQVASNLQQFEAEQASFQTQMRVQYTVDAFNTLAHYLSAFPGRKNLIWFSGSFPIDVMPDGDLQNPFSVMENNDELFRETTNLLARAQVAVYPVDARGLMVDPSFSAANSGRAFARNPSAFGKATQKFAQKQAEEHMTMEQIATDTGGHAFYNNNDLAGAVQKAIEAGSNYYTLTYTPADHNWNGEYRAIRVDLAPNLKAANYRLSYRHGYYADDPFHPRTRDGATGTTTQTAVQSTSHGYTYVQAALAHGAPTPEEILFKVRVLPASTGTEDKLAEANETDPAHPLKPPFRRYMVDFASLPNGFELKPDAHGTYQGAIDYSAMLYDNDGRLLNATGRTVTLDLKPETYKAFRRSAIKGHLEISAPVKGDLYLRVALHDKNSNHVGAVELPLAAVAKLPPLPDPPSPAAAPAASAPAK